jgi:uncharacterized membrane protein HdeD (DUF308 family)
VLDATEPRVKVGSRVGILVRSAVRGRSRRVRGWEMLLVILIIILAALLGILGFVVKVAAAVLVTVLIAGLVIAGIVYVAVNRTLQKR